MAKWSKITPNEPGNYWLCGYPWGRYNNDGPAKVYLVQIKRVSNGIMFICDGNFLFPTGETGVWQKAIIPEPPKTVDDII